MSFVPGMEFGMRIKILIAIQKVSCFTSKTSSWDELSHHCRCNHRFRMTQNFFNKSQTQSINRLCGKTKYA